MSDPVSGSAGGVPTIAETSDEVVIRRSRPLDRGQTVGRYVVLGELGAGGIGVVHAAYDPDSTAVAITLHNMGYLYQTWGRPDDATEVYARARTILAAALGEDHPNVLHVDNNLGTLLRDGHELARARVEVVR